MSQHRATTFHFDDGEKKSVAECIQHMDSDTKARIKEIERLIGISLDVTDGLCDLLKESYSFHKDDSSAGSS